MKPPQDTPAALPCPHCKATSPFDFAFYVRRYYRCPVCDLIFKHQVKDEANTLTYYEQRYFEDHSQDQTSGERTPVYRSILAVLGRYRPPGELLDVGCGCGHFLREARDRGWDVLGVDPSESSIAEARTLVGNAALQGTLDDVPPERRFDVATLINVLDHMIDAGSQLSRLRGHLKPDGLLYLRFPNGTFHAFLVHLFQRMGLGDRANRFLVFHEYALTNRTIQQCLAERGYGILEAGNAHLAGTRTNAGTWTAGDVLRHAFHLCVWATSRGIEKASRGRWIWGPSLQVVARKISDREPS